MKDNQGVGLRRAYLYGFLSQRRRVAKIARRCVDLFWRFSKGGAPSSDRETFLSMAFADQLMLMAILAHEAAMGNATKVAAQILRLDQLGALGMRRAYGT